MADFARIKDRGLWINLDYVIRIEPNVDEAGSATVTFADGSTFTISEADTKRLLSRFQPTKKKKKKKKKAAAAPEAAAPDTSAPESPTPGVAIAEEPPAG